MARLILDDFTGGFENRPWWQRLLNGYSTTTWLVVLNLGSTGLLVSWLMKYADNIVKDANLRESLLGYSWLWANLRESLLILQDAIWFRD
ncbi:CMP-sialic acid transporter 1 [Camellia lanceoleosa]|uniref:CMP-sialic acid transporter 1 n=1 Tax=Camellia lanceoleosa TaxID=1840588 RepID=A0ACC0I333_9ERIC|nr:CMP-sialic acid transporter 1 [Camellia lanceoleosa]